MLRKIYIIMMPEIQKSQILRVVDFLLLGPGMIFIATNAKNIHPSLKILLALAGVGTIVYNGRNYLINRKLIRENKISHIDLITEIEKNG